MLNTDSEGHYDLDGVSMSLDYGVVIAGSTQYINSVSADKNYQSLDEKTLQQVQIEADNTSIKLKTRNAPSEDGILDKTERLSSAKPTSAMDPYLEFEKAGD